ncbi:MAG: hypothetical protein KKF77_03545 [Proteobacteria bacterium]|nr:hypothetical protein [Pseudomonadota bacterium]
MNHTNYLNMSLHDALHHARIMSGKSEDEIGAAMRWNPGNTGRLFGQGSYWPTLPNIPRLCVVLGNTVLLDWLQAQAEAGGVQYDFDAMDCETLLMSLGKMFRELGDVALAGERAVADRHIDAVEAKLLTCKLQRLCATVVRAISGMRPIVTAGQAEE